MRRPDGADEPFPFSEHLRPLVAVLRRLVECRVVRPDAGACSRTIDGACSAISQYFDPDFASPGEWGQPRDFALDRWAAEGRLAELRQWSTEIPQLLAEDTEDGYRRVWELLDALLWEVRVAEVRWSGLIDDESDASLDRHLDEWTFEEVLASRRGASTPAAGARRDFITAPGPPLHVLFVEDEEGICLLYRINFEGEGHRVSMAANGWDGYLTATEVQPDAIVHGLMMPVMDGWEACRRLRGHRRTADIPIVLCTARSAGVDVLRGHFEGADAYLIKPFNPSELLTTVTDLAQRGRGDATPDGRFYPWRADGCLEEGLEAVRELAQQAIAEAQLASPRFEHERWESERILNGVPELITTASFQRHSSSHTQGEQMSTEPAAIVAGDEVQRWRGRVPLERCGFAVIDCEDGAAAYEAAKANPGALIVADLDLEAMDGIDLCRWLSDRTPTSSVILLGHAPWEPRRILEAYQVGASVVMLPHYNPEEIEAVIRHVTGLPDADMVKAQRFLPSQQIPSLTLEVATELLAEAEADSRRTHAVAEKAEHTAERAMEMAERLERLLTELRVSQGIALT